LLRRLAGLTRRRMKILYGVQGTGNGHISRARKMAAHFHARGADVTYLVSGRERAQLFDMECFGDFEHRRGLTMIQRGGAVQYWRTLRQTRALRCIGDVRALDVGGYELVISDFEPITAWAARRAGKTCIGIGHQYAFARGIPQCGNTIASDLVMRWFAPVTVPVGLHWHHFDTDVLPPIIDTGLRREPNARPHILVYLPFERQRAVTALLQCFPRYRFLQYAPELSNGAAGNVGLRRTCLEGFRADLRGAQAVICNAGFELVSECLHMGIPALVKAVSGQMEQRSNALALRRLGWGSVMRELGETDLRRWLDGVRAHATVRYPDVAAALVDWILAGDWRTTAALRDSLWSRTTATAN
jgi:uncharacterized protein (TIGR00661 family)